MARVAPCARRDVTRERIRPPLILSAQLPPDIHRWATRLRAAHYPPERNFLEAHVTLFHALPAPMEPELLTYLACLCRGISAPPARLGGVMNLGGGTALGIDSPALLGLREEIAGHCHGMLTAQDQGQPRLHITIQNKVARQLASRLQRELSHTVEPRDFRFVGLQLYRYRGGPWEPVKRFAFRG